MQENQLRSYKDGETEYGIKGTVLPRAEGPSDQLNAGFNMHKAQPMNIVEMDENGTTKVTELNAQALALLQAANRPGGNPIDYLEAARLASLTPATVPTEPPPVVKVSAPSVATLPPPPVIVSMPAPSFTLATRAELNLFPQMQGVHTPVEPKSTLPKIRVRFSGAFGAFSVPFNEVLLEDLAIVLIQYGERDNLYEPPVDSQQRVSLSFEGQTYRCIPAFSYEVPSQTAFHTVYLLDKEGSNVQE